MIATSIESLPPGMNQTLTKAVRVAGPFQDTANVPRAPTIAGRNALTELLSTLNA